MLSLNGMRLCKLMAMHCYEFRSPPNPSNFAWWGTDEHMTPARRDKNDLKRLFWTMKGGAFATWALEPPLQPIPTAANGLKEFLLSPIESSKFCQF